MVTSEEVIGSRSWIWSNSSRLPKWSWLEMRPPKENLIFFDFFFFCPWGVSFSSERAFWGMEAKGHEWGSSYVHSCVFFDYLHLFYLRLWKGLQVSESFFFFWCHYNFIGKTNDFVCLHLALPFRVLVALVEPFSLLLLSWFVRLFGSLVFLLLIGLSRARLLLVRIVRLFLVLSTRTVLVPPLILIRRTASNDIRLISWWRGFSGSFWDPGGKGSTGSTKVEVS